MITIHKIPKPSILVEKENNWTSELMKYVSSGQSIPDHVKGRYRDKEIKDTLLSETNHKCAYCESKITHIDYGDIEHIIPKSKVPDKTFSWENLTIGCGKCNQNKKDYFDTNLPLLNPYTDKPEEKIMFMGAFPFSTLGCESAYFTIKKLKLDRPELIERRGDLLKKIQPFIRQYETAISEDLRKVVLEDLLELTQPDKEFSLMVRQLLDRLAITA